MIAFRSVVVCSVSRTAHCRMSIVCYTPKNLAVSYRFSIEDFLQFVSTLPETTLSAVLPGSLSHEELPQGKLKQYFYRLFCQCLETIHSSTQYYEARGLGFPFSITKWCSHWLVFKTIQSCACYIPTRQRLKYCMSVYQLACFDLVLMFSKGRYIY